MNALRRKEESALNPFRPWHWLACLLLLVSPLIHGEQRNLVIGDPGNRDDIAERVALVIGNGDYAEARLKNPRNDAKAMAAALRGLGFEVIERENANLRQMDEAVREFGRKLERAHVGLFYFAGHGMQIKGRNYLIPVDANFEYEDEVAYRSFDAGQVLDKMESARTRTNLVVLDACRNNPFHRAFRARQLGLAEMEAPPGTLIAFATAPGAVALDGAGDHGIYTKHLLKQMTQPGKPVEQVFKQVRIGVSDETRGRQIPWEASSLREDFQFLPAGSAAAPATTEAALELAFWETIMDSQRAADYAAYLEQFPAGRFAALARIRQKELAAGDVASRPPAVTASPALSSTPKPPSATGAAASRPPSRPTLPPVAGDSEAARPYLRLADASHSAASFSTDDALLAIASRDGRLRLFDAATGAAKATHHLGAQAFSAVRFSPDGAHLALGAESGEILFLEFASGKQVWRAKPHAARIQGLAFSPDGRYLLSASVAGDVELTAIATRKAVQRLDDIGAPLSDVQYSPEGRYFAVVAGADGRRKVKVFEVGKSREQLTVTAEAASFSVNGRYLLAAVAGDTPVLYDIAGGGELQRFARYPRAIFAGAYAASGDFIASVDAQGGGRLVSTRDGKVVQTLASAPVKPLAVAFSADGRRFAVIDPGGLAAYRFGEPQ